MTKQLHRNAISGFISVLGMTRSFRSFFNSYSQIKTNEHALKAEGYKFNTYPSYGSENYTEAVVIYETEE